MESGNGWCDVEAVLSLCVDWRTPDLPPAKHTSGVLGRSARGCIHPTHFSKLTTIFIPHCTNQFMSGQKKKRAPAKAQKKPKPKKAVAKRRVDNEVVAEVAEQKAAVETARLLAKWKRVTTLLRPRRGRPLPKPVWKPVLYLRGLGVWSRNERERPVRRKLSTLLAAAGVTWMKLVKVSGSAIKMNIFAFLQLQ